MKINVNPSSLLFIISLLIISCNKSSTKKPETPEGQKSIFTIPIPNIQIENTSYQLNNSNDTVLTYKTGSKIITPSNAFVDKEENPVKGPIELTYREFTNPLDIYLSGIPMEYNIDGIEQVFETAGMIEINASSNGQTVFPNPESKIQVEMNSFQKGSEYDVYQLDTLTGNWRGVGKDEVKLEDFNKRMAALPVVPPAPKKATQYAFSIGDDTGKHPELAMYKNVLFEPLNNDHCGFDATKIDVAFIGDGIFEVTFIFDALGHYKKESYKCYLAFMDGEDYHAAMKAYQKKYGALIQKRKKLKKQLENDWEKYREAKAKYNIAKFNMDIIDLSESEKVTRMLKINNFGFINIDKPTLFPQGAILSARFVNKEGAKLALHNIVLVEKGRNAVFRYKSEIKFNPQQENILWGVTEEGKIAYYKDSDFKMIDQTQGEYTFRMNVHEVPLKTYEDICELLF